VSWVIADVLVALPSLFRVAVLVCERIALSCLRADASYQRSQTKFPWSFE